MNMNMSMPMNHSMDHDNMTHSTDHNMMNHDMHGPEHELEHGPMHMQMYFYFGVSNVIVLFEDWKINSVGAMIGSCIGIFVMSMLYEGLKVLRDVLQRKGRDFASRPHTDQNFEKKTSTKQAQQGESHVISWGIHFIQALLHMLQVTVSYFLMLIAMTYNVWLFTAVVLGAGAGYLLFAKCRQSRTSSLQDTNEHCN